MAHLGMHIFFVNFDIITTMKEQPFENMGKGKKCW